MTHPLPSLQVHGLSFGYPHCAVFDNFHATLSPGLTLLRGDESCGKTTLLRLLASELTPQAGRLVLAGLDARSDPDGYRARVFWADPRSDGLNDLTPRAWFTGLSQQHGAWDAADYLSFNLSARACAPLLAPARLPLVEAALRAVAAARAGLPRRGPLAL